MAPADDVEGAARTSALYTKYGTRVDAESAREMLAARLEQPAPVPAQVKPVLEPKHRAAAKATRGGADTLTDFLGSRQGRAIERQVVRGIFGLLRKSL